MNIFEFLNCRYEYEVGVTNLKIPRDNKSGTIHNMKWFIEEGFKKNRFRPGAEDVLKVCESVINSTIEA